MINQCNYHWELHTCHNLKPLSSASHEYKELTKSVTYCLAGYATYFNSRQVRLQSRLKLCNDQKSSNSIPSWQDCDILQSIDRCC